MRVANWIPRILAAGLFALTLNPGAAAANLLANPGFETGGGSYTGWFTFGPNVLLSLPAGDNIIRTGSAASKTFGAFSGCPGAPTFSASGFGQAFTPTSGKIYQLSGYSYVSSADPIMGTTTCTKNRMIAKIVFFNAASGGSEISSNEMVIGDGNTPTNQWLPFSVSAPVPSGALRVEALFIYLQPACDPGAVYLDDASFDEITPVAEANVLTNPSFSSGLTGWNPFGNVFAQSGVGTVRTPTGSAKMFSTFVTDSPSGIFQGTAATPSTLWELDAHTMTTCLFGDAIQAPNDNFVLGRIVFRDAGNNEIGSNDAVFLDNSASPGQWSRRSVTAVAPAGTVTAEAYILFISPTLMGGSMFVDDVGFRNLGTVDVAPAAAPSLELAQNVPNPFRTATRIDFSLARAGDVDVSIYDLAGRRVARLLRGAMTAGPHAVTWDGRTSSGVSAAPGVYLYVVRTDAERQARHMLLLP